MPREHRVVAVALALVGCAPPAKEASDPTSATVATTLPTTPPASTPTTSTPSPTPTTPTEPYDCDTVPRDPISVTEVANAHAFEDVLFDTAGHLIGAFHEDLVEVDSAGVFGVLAPGVGDIRGMDRLLDGDIVADGFAMGLIRVTPAGVSSPLSSQGGYGVVVAPDGAVYLAQGYGIYRVDPATGDAVLAVDAGDVTPQALDASPDFRRLYVGPSNGNGDIYSVELGPDYLPTTGLQLYASGVGRGYVDGIGTDVCGNVYVADYDKRSLYRIWTTGEVQLLRDEGETLFGHGMEWGSGIGGWSETALFQPQPYNGDTVMQLELGVPGRRYRGAVIHAGDTGAPPP